MKSALAKEKIRDRALVARTGKARQEWFALLDKAGARKMDRRAIAALLGKRFGVKSGSWQQMVTVGFEQARGLRQKHEKPAGFEVSASKAIAAPLAMLYQAWTDEKLRRRWLAGAKLAISKATPNKSVRTKWGDGVGRVSVLFYPKGEKNQLTVQHGRLPNARAAERAQAYWKMRLGKLEAFVAGKS